MTESNIDNDVRGFYEDQQFAEPHVQLLVQSELLRHQLWFWKRASIAAAVAVIGIGFICLRFLSDNDDLENRIAELESRKPSTIESVAREESPLPETVPPSTPMPSFQLIAFRSHDDSCPHCKATEEIFVDLKKELGTEAVNFRSFDLSDTEESKSTRSEIDKLKLTPLIAGKAETGFLVLTDQSGLPISEYRPSAGLDQISAAVEDIVQQ